ncbi:Ankyrin repeat-containing protein [Micromonospora pallida]|uniref:Ankyrin repeat-containing protein n=1 Tax=Micromonospora pallida TaxID=145854 RepID=A0A1C6SG58_9ACTN|nr:ankyrin repeat domain-containing protein [Micromonospora pallida]SCL28456.1 Ankyrin repeat-containing protein [Micromonospora pallida]
MERRRERDRQLRLLRYASPPAMVAAVTARRRAGDWRGACAAALVDAHVDLRDVTSRYGTDEAARIEGELRGLAPDLLRRFLPRTDSLTLVPRATVVLSRLRGPFPTDTGRLGPGVPLLVATLPLTERAPQRVGLRVTDSGRLPSWWYDLPGWCWDADEVAARRWAYGASAVRLPWHSLAGCSYPQGDTATSDHAGDRAAEVERVAALLAARQPVAAYDAAGVAVDPDEVWQRGPWFEARLVAHAPALPVLVDETRRLAHRYAVMTQFSADRRLAVEFAAGDRLTVRAAAWNEPAAGPCAFGVPAPADVALLGWGALTPDDLHPLVHEALFPGRAQRWQAPEAAPHPPIRVRCGPDWHLVRIIDGRLATPQHSDEELRREFVLAGLGGPLVGCAAAVRAWRTGAKPLPKELRKVRQDIFARALHGDTDGLLALLADGLDPGLRDSTGSTLMHWLSHLDHVRMLPALTAAGLDVNGRDRDGRTPLHAAAVALATEVMSALLAAGADPDVVDVQGHTAAGLLATARKLTRR